jgi:hypothetical protein
VIDIVERRRLELCDPGIAGSKQPFHTAEPMAFSDAELFIARCRTATETLAHAAIASLSVAATKHQLKMTNCALLCASGRRLPALKNVLASHALIHAAEGEFYRGAISGACKRLSIRVIRIRERDTLRQAVDASGVTETEIKERLAAMGKSLGPPWREDQKLATLAALIALA